MKENRFKLTLEFGSYKTEKNIQRDWKESQDLLEHEEEITPDHLRKMILKVFLNGIEKDLEEMLLDIENQCIGGEPKMNIINKIKNKLICLIKGHDWLLLVDTNNAEVNIIEITTEDGKYNIRGCERCGSIYLLKEENNEKDTIGHIKN